MGHPVFYFVFEKRKVPFDSFPVVSRSGQAFDSGIIRTTIDSTSLGMMV